MDSDRVSELKAFDDTKAGVKGLVDSGITELPTIFILPDPSPPDPAETDKAAIPVIDLAGAVGSSPELRRRAVAEICAAAETYGFLQVVNHGISAAVLEEMLKGGRRFFEQDLEEKKKYFTRDFGRSLVYNSNYDLYTSSTANWRDSLSCVMSPTRPKLEDIPLACREILVEYSNKVMELAEFLMQLLSEALGLRPDYLKSKGCAEGHVIHCHYSPPCPQPEKTMATPKHSDSTFITVLLQDQVGGLQVLHHHRWFHVPPVPGALLVNIGDLLQLMSNGKFKSVEHRVVANGDCARVSVASFFNGTRLLPSSRMYGPIEELVSEANPAKYRQTTIKDYLLASLNKGLDGTSGLDRLKISDV